MSPPSVLFAAGGTGGHVRPALATASALRDAGADVAVEFVGTAAGLEARLVPAAGWRLHTVAALPLRRRVHPDLLRLPFVLVRAARRLVRLIRRRDVAAACVFGGYVSGPLALAAWRAGIPLVVHEQNAVPGLANRIAARWAAAVAVSVPDARDAFGDPDRVQVTGNPVGADLAAADLPALRAEALERFGLDPGRRTLLVFGGSLGARRLNDAVLAAAGGWRAPERLQVLHASGSRDHDRVARAWRETAATSALRVRCVEFIEDMALAYATADLVLCRAGASTVAELTVAGIPSILVPYPHSVADEQTANARALAEAGAAVLVADADLDGACLVRGVEALLDEPGRLSAMADAARGLGRPDAAERLAALVLDAAAGRLGVARRRLREDGEA